MSLSERMDFDHVIRIHADGTITDEPDVYAPDVYDETIYSDDWEWATFGYTGQDSYRGPIMHNSEQIGGRLERDLMDHPGVYVAVVAYWTPESDDDDAGSTSEGWAILRLIGSDDDE